MKIVCSKCKVAKGVRKDVMEQRIKKFGSLEKLNAEYLCRDCRPSAKKTNKKTGTKKIKGLRRSLILNPRRAKKEEAMQMFRNGELWFQQPDYEFLRREHRPMTLSLQG